MNYLHPKTPMTKGNMVVKDDDKIIDVSWIFGPDIYHMTTDQRWTQAARNDPDTFGGYPEWAPDKAYLMETVRAVVDQFDLYEMFQTKRMVFQVVVRDPETWGLHSHIVPILSDIGEGFRLRIDPILNHNPGREDLAWGMIREVITEQHPWQGVIHPDQLTRTVEQIRKYFNTNNVMKELRKGLAAFLAIKKIPGMKMESWSEKDSPVEILSPEAYFQIELVNKYWIPEDPLEAFHRG